MLNSRIKTKETISDKIGYGLTIFLPTAIAQYYQTLVSRNNNKGINLKKDELESLLIIDEGLEDRLDSINNSENILISTEKKLKEFNKGHKNKYDLEFYDKDSEEYDLDFRGNEIGCDLIEANIALEFLKQNYDYLAEIIYKADVEETSPRKRIVKAYSGIGKLLGFMNSCKETYKFGYANPELLVEGSKLFFDDENNIFSKEVNKREREDLIRKYEEVKGSILHN